jgi:hypothetical protein
MRNRYAKVALDALLQLALLALMLLNIVTMPVCAGLAALAMSAGNYLAALVAFGIGWAFATLLLIVADLCRLQRLPAPEPAAPHAAT